MLLYGENPNCGRFLLLFVRFQAQRWLRFFDGFSRTSGKYPRFQGVWMVGCGSSEAVTSIVHNISIFNHYRGCSNHCATSQHVVLRNRLNHHTEQGKLCVLALKEMYKKGKCVYKGMKLMIWFESVEGSYSHVRFLSGFWGRAGGQVRM